MKGSFSPRIKPSVRVSTPLGKTFLEPRNPPTALGLRYVAFSGEERLDYIALIFRTIQILAAARRSMTFSELNFAGETLFRLLGDHCGGAGLNEETQSRIARREIDYVELCAEVMYVDSSGNVEFCHPDMRRTASSVEFQRRFGLRNASEVLTAICIQHLGCGEQSQGLRSMRAKDCPVSGQATCTFQAYAAMFWKQHYLETDGGSQWIHFLLHEAVVSSAAKGGCPDMQCQRRCNRVLATGLEMAATHDLHVIGRTYVEMGAEVGPCTHSCHTPLHTAVANSSVNMVKLLLECGANPNAFANDKSGAPEPPCGLDEHAVPTSLINCGPNCWPNHEEKRHCWRCCGYASGRTPLHVAAAVGSEALIRLLVAAGAILDLPTLHQGDTELHLAVMSGNVDAVRCLIDLGANVSIQNFAGETALKVALRGQLYSTAKSLRSAVCHPAYRDASFDGVSAHAEASGVDEKEHTTPDSFTLDMQHLSLQATFSPGASLSPPTPLGDLEEAKEEVINGTSPDTSTGTGDGTWVLL